VIPLRISKNSNPVSSILSAQLLLNAFRYSGLANIEIFVCWTMPNTERFEKVHLQEIRAENAVEGE
jgi:hypothetical protein